MKICLIHPDHPNSTDDRLDPPLGLLYIASHLRKNNFNVEICDLSGLEQYNIPYADIYGITVYITSIDITKKIIKQCKHINQKCKIIVGGAHPTACPNDFNYVDHVVVGYGEIAMLDIVSGKVLEHIIIGQTPDDYFLFPSYDLIKPETYHRRIANNISLPYLTSRGCPGKCTFCGLEQMHKQLGYKVIFANENVVIEHLKRIKYEFGITSINFQDDIFTLLPKRLFKILDTVKSLGMKFRCMGKAGIDTEDVYKILADSGVEQISWGIESGSQYILDRMKKQVKVKDNYNVIQWAKKYGITSRAFFIIGFPGETEKTLEETKQFIINAGPDQCFVSTMVPYPGTDVGNNPEKYGIIKIYDDYSQYYQVGKDGTGGLLNFDTEWLNRLQFQELELKFREWVKIYMQNKPQEKLQDYEKILYKK
jgi:anaerobic magnesium-protoporphyrin IX monomethyl ester cyclase